MNEQSEDELYLFARRWRFRGCSVNCTRCGAFHRAADDDKPVEHGAHCDRPDGEHPWRELREILNGRPDGANTHG